MWFRKEKLTQGIDRGIDHPVLPAPVWVEELRQEIRAMGDIIRLREALAVAHRDLERMRLQRDRMIQQLGATQNKLRELEQVVTNLMRK
jgi:hypothetical protein